MIFVFFIICAIGIFADERTLEVVRSYSGWRVKGHSVVNPTLLLHCGTSYTFIINASGHPFTIKDNMGLLPAFVEGNSEAMGKVMVESRWPCPSFLYYEDASALPVRGLLSFSSSADQDQHSPPTFVAGYGERYGLSSSGYPAHSLPYYGHNPYDYPSLYQPHSTSASPPYPPQ